MRGAKRRPSVRKRITGHEREESFLELVMSVPPEKPKRSGKVFGGISALLIGIWTFIATLAAIALLVGTLWIMAAGIAEAVGWILGT